eukprot:TRINITY_DN10395_c0_g1_i1.p1 TRINITY_DN10395_c0_g1~~TRINITY_DN10395_c0_g1_i1.p1  ORF type:complete len:415 (-),score=83.85 TRINITY_DN10395_c0_g1_i1:33-1277(-)
MSNPIKKIPPQHYLHLLDSNTNVVRLELGPKILKCKDQEVCVYGPSPFVVIPPRHYVIISNPVVTKVGPDGNKEVVCDKFGQVQLRHGDEEVRLEQEPFPLYPGESVVGKPTALEIVDNNTAFRLQALRDFYDEKFEVDRKAGDEWYYTTLGAFVPLHPNAKIVHKTKPTVVKSGEALKLIAIKDFVDRTGTPRKAGEEWLYSKAGVFLPQIQEKILSTVTPYILTEKSALHLSTQHSFEDVYGVKRHPGEEWLVTNKNATTHYLDVHETLVGVVNITSVGRQEFVTIINPVDDNLKPQFGKKKIVRGETNFFLQPGESLGTNGVQKSIVITNEEALLVRAIEDGADQDGISRKAGEIWLFCGPKEYLPSLNIEIVRQIRPYLKLGNYALFRKEVPTMFAFLFVMFLYIFFRVL